MNLQSKKARVPIAALGVTALIAAAGAIASPALAAGTTLAFGPTGTSATIVNVDPNIVGMNGSLTYGLKVTGSSDTDPLYLAAPVGNPGSLSVSREPASAAPFSTTLTTATAALDTSVAVASTAGLAVGDSVTFRGGTPETKAIATIPDGTHFTVSSIANVHAIGSGVSTAFSSFAAGASIAVPGYVTATGDNIFIGATVPGDYTFTLFKDHNANGIYDAAQDDATPTFNLHVKDVTTNTVTTSDDLNFGLTAPATSGVGQAVLATATMGGLTTSDTRGGNTLADKIALATTFTYGGTAAGQANTGSPTYGTAYTRSSGAVSAAGTVITTATLGTTGTASATTTVAGNGVTGVVLAATNVVGSVATDAVTSTTTNVKTGTAAVTYTATVANSVTAADIAGKTVYFTLGGTDAASLTTNGATVDAATYLYSAVTSSSGVASLTVTDGATTPNTYTVAAKSNNISQTGIVRTALYADATATTAAVTNTDAELTPTVAAGISVTLKGKLTDQFGALFVPGLAANQIVVVTAPAGGATICNAPISAGTFSCAYTPATTPTAGTSTTFRFSYTGGANPLVNSAINWASNTAASSVTLTTPTDAATAVTLQDSTTPIATQVNGGTVPFGNATGAVTGTVNDATNAPLAFKSVTLTGSPGVLFSTDSPPVGTTTTDDLMTSITVVTDNVGHFTAFAYFTKSGAVSVTATSGTVSDVAAVTTNVSTDPYKVMINDATGTPGSTLIVTGMITDAFGNPVPSSMADLSIGTSTLGAFGDASPVTNAAGVFSTTFTSGSNQSGVADLTAILHGQSVNPVASANWLANAGVTVADGDYLDAGTITIANIRLTVTATTRITAGYRGGTTHLSGTFMPNTSLEIDSKPSGSRFYSFIDTARTDANGDWSASETIKKSTYFVVRSAGLSSLSDSTLVYSRVSLTAKALGHGRVSLYANGDPNTRATLSFYRSVAGKDPKIASKMSSSYGSGTVTVKLPKGTRKVYVLYTAPGTGRGSSKLVTIKVK